MEPEQLVPVLDAKRLAGKIFRSTDLGPPVSVDQKPEAAIDVKYITHSFTIDSSKMIFVCWAGTAEPVILVTSGSESESERLMA